jgi:transcriptional regulator GlxA family with amidase domain
MVKFQTSPGKGELVLGCASVSATIGSGFGLFDSLSEPLSADGTSASLLPIFRMMLEELSRPSVGTRAVVGALMKHVLIVVLREHLSRSGSGTPLFLPMLNPQLGKALTAIILRPHEPHRVEELARLAGMSRSRFAHHFARTYGRAPMDFVQSVRLAAARKLLRGSDLPIKSIAAAVGYASRSHFSRAFRAEFGVDPTRFRSTVDGGLKLEVRGDDLELAAAE